MELSVASRLLLDGDSGQGGFTVGFTLQCLVFWLELKVRKDGAQVPNFKRKALLNGAT